MLSRRHFLGSLAVAGAAPAVIPAQAQVEIAHSGHGTTPALGSHQHDGANLVVGAVDHARNEFDPHKVLLDFDTGKLVTDPNGSIVREWEIVAVDKEVEIAPGVMFPAWTFNGRIPGPTLRCKE